MSGPRRLSVPRRVAVTAGEEGCPLTVDGRTVDSVRESWLVEDRWWTDRPLRRRYWEVVTMCGRDEIVFHEDHILAVHAIHRPELVREMDAAELRKLAQWLASNK